MIDSTHPAVRRIEAIEALARESDVPVDTVASMYHIEVTKLERVARIKTYVPVLAGRRVRSLLRDGVDADVSVEFAPELDHCSGSDQDDKDVE